MTILQIQGLRKILGAHEILRGVDLAVDNSEKIGIVGRNGGGKTTLLRLMTGEMEPDVGSVHLAKGARMGYVSQRPVYEPGVTPRSYVESGLDEVHRLEKEIEALGVKMGEVDGKELDQVVTHHGELIARMEFLGGWEAERKVETVLDGIGLPRKLWDREAGKLSGGEKSRTQMARELVSSPDLLLLDEPTNHLDLAGIEWIENWLREMNSAVVMVSHDRRMLDRVVDTIIEVQRGQLQRYPGNYSRYVALKQERFDVGQRAWEIQRDQIRREEAFIKKHIGSQRTAEAKGRRKRLQSVVRLEQPFDDVRKPLVKVQEVTRGGEEVLIGEGISVGYGDVRVLDKVDIRVSRVDRIGVVGPNGSGKTTIMKALAGLMEIQGGELQRGYKAVCGYYDQETSELREENSVYTEIRRDHPQMTDLEIRSHLAQFLFRGDREVELKVAGLSGGERARLSLARLVLSGPSWLALDEPTNHLDLAGRTALEEMLSAFPGALFFISHDRQFLDDLATRIVEVKDGKLRSFKGNYTDYRNAILEEQNASKAVTDKKRKAEKDKAHQQRTAPQQQAKQKGPGKRKPAPPKRKPRNPWELEKVENAIMELEKKREKLLAKMSAEDTYKDAELARDVQFQMAEVERDLEKKNSEWEELIS
ncbi:MAG: ATP-binding cassette subfamily F protein 3 [Planctomycetota bacterium]|jgi:ATP-binding cassette subfamily F protein 3